jgi:hypothetical protein
LADANGNPVPDGTVVNFVSDGGSINRTCSTTTANSGGLNAGGFSRCSVALISSNPRPHTGTSPSGVVSTYPTNGRVHVLAYVEGIKTYKDVNNNNQFDAGVDIVTDQGDAYRDDNEDGHYNAGEFVISKGGNLSCVNPASGGNPLLAINTVGDAGAPNPSRASTCTGANSIATTVRAQTAIAFSSDQPYISAYSGALNQFVLVGDMFGLDGVTRSARLPMPKGTAVAATSSVSTCTVTVNPAIVPNTPIGSDASAIISSVHTFTTSGTGCSGSSLTVKTMTPSGVQGSYPNPSSGVTFLLP